MSRRSAPHLGADFEQQTAELRCDFSGRRIENIARKRTADLILTGAEPTTDRLAKATSGSSSTNTTNGLSFDGKCCKKRRNISRHMAYVVPSFVDSTDKLDNEPAIAAKSCATAKKMYICLMI